MGVNVLLVLTVVWIVVVLLGGALFGYFAWVVKDDFCTRRYPIIGLVQVVCLTIWVFILLQASSLGVIYQPQIPYDAILRSHIFIMPVVIPLFVTGFFFKGFSLTLDLYMTRRLIFESTKKGSDWTEILTPLELKIFRLQAWILRSDSFMTSRHYPQTTLIKGMLWCILVSVCVLVPGGMYWAGCFSPDVGFPVCTTAKYFKYQYSPMNLFFVFYSAAVPVLLYLLRNLRDPLFIRTETCANYIILMTLFAFYLLAMYSDFFNAIDRLECFLPALILAPWTVVTMFYMPVGFCIRNLLNARRQSCDIDHSRESFLRILKERPLFEELKRIAAQNFSLENGLFWEDLMTIDRMAKDSRTPKDALQQGLRRLYTDYIPVGSPRELNLLSNTRQHLTSEYWNACLTIDSFAGARKEVENLLYTNTFPQLVWTIRSRQAPPSPSISSHNSAMVPLR